MESKPHEVTIKDMRYRLEAEGEGYALLHYYGRNISCEDKTAENLWKSAYDALIKLTEYVNNVD